MSTKKSKNASKPQTETRVDEAGVASQLEEGAGHPADEAQPAQQQPESKPKKERQPDPLREQMQALASEADVALKVYKEHAEVAKLARQTAQEALDVYRAVQAKRKELRAEMERRVLERLSKKYGGAQ